MKNQLNPIQKGFLLLLWFFCSALFSQENENVHTSVKENKVVVLEPSYTNLKYSKSFGEKYHYLVARAYFKLLSQAQKSERKLRMEFERYPFKEEKFDKKKNRVFQNKGNLAYRKYKAHSAMLSGLKAWNLFSEYRTGDMLYFMKEHENFIFKMYKRRLSEDKMVNYLIYKLADLYHFEEEN